MTSSITSPPLPADLLRVATETAMAAGELLRSGFGTSFRVDNKEGRHNLVTEYDHAAEKLIFSTIRAAFPDHVFLGEESGGAAETPPNTIRWIVDPLDGTVNFAHSIPIFCVSIGAERINADGVGELVCGVIFAPMTNELFTASLGGGAFLNGAPIHVSSTAKLDDAILVTGFPYNANDNPLGCIDHFGRFVRMGLPVRRLGSAAIDLAYLAAGRFDGYWEVSLQPWDVTAGKLILAEAGGMMTRYDGTPHSIMSGTMLATNGRIHEEMQAVLA
jgi:myo-inositol-1(or 4)-monophosphatase